MKKAALAYVLAPIELPFWVRSSLENRSSSGVENGSATRIIFEYHD